jgi:hypothetical protein
MMLLDVWAPRVRNQCKAYCTNYGNRQAALYVHHISSLPTQVESHASLWISLAKIKSKKKKSITGVCTSGCVQQPLFFNLMVTSGVPCVITVNVCTFSSPIASSLSSSLLLHFHLSFLYVPYVMPGVALSRHILELATEPGGVESLSVKEWVWGFLSSFPPRSVFMTLGRLCFSLLSMFDLTHLPVASLLPLSFSFSASLVLAWFPFCVESALRDNECYVYSENQRINILTQLFYSCNFFLCLTKLFNFRFGFEYPMYAA